jgi:hypothetical protein
MTKIVVGSTIPAFKMAHEGYWYKWLDNARQVIERTKDEIDVEVSFVATLQHDARGQVPFELLLRRLEPLDASVYWFSVDTGEDEITSGNRYFSICMGRNLIIDHALRGGHDYIYFADCDISVPDNVLVKLMDLCWPVTAAHVPTYCLGINATMARDVTEAVGHRWKQIRASANLGGDVRVHWTTAGSLLVHRDVFRRVPWRWDPDAGDTDDPATQHEMEKLGYPTLVRHDVIATHWPQNIMGLEQRGHDRRVYR